MSQAPSDRPSTEFFAGDPPPQAAPPRPRRRDMGKLRDNLLLGVMPVVSAGVLWLLSQRGGPAMASAQQLQNEIQVETAITSLAGRNSGLNKLKTQTILDNFYHEARQRQVPADRVKGNPFIFKFPRGAAGAPETRPAAAAAAPVPPPEDPERTAAMNAVKQLTLQSVLSGAGSRPIATISNNLLTEGEVISGWTIAKITPTEVFLTWRGQRHVLKMKE